MDRSFTLIAALACAACVHRAPPNPIAVEYNTRCAAALAAGQLDDAEALCDHALEFCDYYWDAQTNKGLIRKLRNDRSGAKAWFIRALRNNENQHQAANNLGVMYLEDGRLAEAEAMFHQALEGNPDYAEARSNLAAVHLRQRKFAQAEKAYRQLIISAPLVTNGYLGLGRALLLQQKAADAVPPLEQAVLLEPGRAEAWLLLAGARLDLGQRDGAKDAAGRCLDEDPSEPDCRRLVRELQ
ncbi:MAG: tetratricopeptide repeat protein [Myxococcaceae bacterium]|jgi:tetratricopeptide (TPR) repeat protein|nr:tetratricopeptide repeat protein [Myxococcaceae bacterium]